MTTKHPTKRILIASILVLAMCFTALIGTTFAWFTDSVTSSGNKIVSGTLIVDLELLGEDNTTWSSIKENKTPLYTYENWEPGYVDVKVLKVENEGSLALKWKAKFVSDTELGILADVIDVYVLPYGVLADDATVAYPADRDLTGYTKVGTLKEFVNTIETTTYGELKSQETAYLGIALKMQETAGNDYQDETLGAFDIQIVATQFTHESDSFDKNYDKDATLDFAPVSTAQELSAAVANREENIVLTDDIVVDETFSIDYDANIDGAGYTITRTSGISLMSRARSVETPTVHTGVMIEVAAGTTLTLENIVIDGGAIWTGEINETLGRGTVNEGITATGALISTVGNANLVLGEGVVLQNNCGANAISLATRGNGSLTLNGAHIINNTSAAGAIWGGDDVTINEGTVISYNHATSIGGAFRMVNGYNAITFTMNGGEISHNYSSGTGGAIWGGNNAKYYFNGGEIAYNEAASAGGAIWTGTYESYYISGDFTMHDNKGGELAGAVRFCDHTSLTMTGGRIYNNTVNGESNAFFLNNNSTSITGGYIGDNFSYSGGLGLVIGNEAEIDGVITYGLNTNHNTAYLTTEIVTIYFTVNTSAANFAEFNFDPADGYTYTEGDEEKLVCMTEGYETYWDAATSTFRLKTVE